MHKVIEAARVLNLEDDPPPPFLFTSAEAEAAAAEIIGWGGPVLAIAPGANWVGARPGPPSVLARPRRDCWGRAGRWRTAGC